ncbi:MAG: hypothetical protein Q9196_004053 [Gyalolechia fulgens]
MPTLVDPLDSGEDTDSWPGPAYQHVAKAPKKRPGPNIRTRKPPAKRPRRLIDAALEISVRRKKTDRMVQTMKRLLIEGSESTERSQEDTDDEDTLVATFIDLQAKGKASGMLATEHHRSDDTVRVPSTCESQCIVSADHHHLVSAANAKDEKIKLLERMVAAANSRFEDKDAECEQLKIECQVNKDQVQQWKDRSNDQHGVNRGLETSKEAFGRREKQLMDQREELVARVTLRDFIRRSMLRRIHDESKRAEQWRQRAITSNNENFILSARVRNLQADLTTTTKDLQSARATLHGQSKRVSQLQQEAATAANANTAVSAQVKNLQADLTTKTKDLQSTRATLQDQSKRVSQLQQEATTAANANTAVSAQVKNLQADLTTKTKDLQSTRTTLQDQSKRIAQLQQDATTAAKANTTLSLQVRVLLGDVEVKTRDLRSTQGVLDESASKIQELEGANSIARRSLEACQSQVVGLQDQQRNLQAQFNATESRLQDEICRTKKHYATLTEKWFEASSEIRTRDTQIQKLTDDAKDVQQTMLSNDARFRQRLDQYKQRLEEAEKRANELDRTVQENRRSWMQEIKVLVGVEDGDHRKLLDCLGIPHTGWSVAAEGRHQGCLNSQSSMLQGRRPFPTSAATPLHFTKDINLQLIKVSLGTASAKTGQSTSLLWDLWALLEGTTVQSTSMEQIACAVASLTKHLFQLFSQGNITDLEFWIAAQIFCTLLPWGFAELDLDNILLPTLSCDQIDRPLVTAAFSRIHVSRKSGSGLPKALFTSFEICAKEFPDQCKCFHASMDGSRQRVALLHLVSHEEVLLLVEDTKGSCVLWHDEKVKCGLFDYHFRNWLRVDRGGDNPSLLIEVNDDLLSWMAANFSFSRPPDHELSRCI